MAKLLLTSTFLSVLRPVFSKSFGSKAQDTKYVLILNVELNVVRVRLVVPIATDYIYILKQFFIRFFKNLKSKQN